MAGRRSARLQSEGSDQRKRGRIIHQYVRFCRVFNKQVRLYGQTRKAVEETIRICQDENVLKEYLERQRAKIIDIMLALFDEETMMKNHDAAVERKAKKEGEKDTAGLMAYLLKNGRSDDAIKASEDESFLNKLLAEFRSGKMTAR